MRPDPCLDPTAPPRRRPTPEVPTANHMEFESTLKELRNAQLRAGIPQKAHVASKISNSPQQSPAKSEVTLVTGDLIDEVEDNEPPPLINTEKVRAVQVGKPI